MTGEHPGQPPWIEPSLRFEMRDFRLAIFTNQPFNSLDRMSLQSKIKAIVDTAAS